MITYNKTYIGYQHVKEGKECQDYSARFKDIDKYIVTSCDGHGGTLYIRSSKGSKFASKALVKVLKELSYDQIVNDSKFFDSIKLKILCEWNNMISKDLKTNKITKKETENLNENQRRRLKINPTEAYGTTLIGSLLYKDKCLVIHLGDGESFFIKNNTLEMCFTEGDDEPVGNLTYSMCSEDAFKHIKVSYVDANTIKGVLLCTDGLVNPFNSYENFKKEFYSKYIKNLKDPLDIKYLTAKVKEIGSKTGIGDDVSLGLILNTDIKEMANIDESI